MNALLWVLEVLLAAALFAHGRLSLTPPANMVEQITDPSDGVTGTPGKGVTDGKVTAFISDLTPDTNPITAAEGVALAADGTVYGGVVPAQMLQKHRLAR